MKKVYILIFTIFTLNIANAQWKKVINFENNYEISFPGIAEKDNNPNTKDKIYYYTGENKNYYLIASCGEYKSKITKNYTSEDEKQAFYNDYTKSFNATKINEKKSHYQNFEALDFYFSAQNMGLMKYGRLRIIIAGKKMFALIYLYSKYDLNIQNKFFNSLVIK